MGSIRRRQLEQRVFSGSRSCEVQWPLHITNALLCSGCSILKASLRLLDLEIHRHIAIDASIEIPLDYMWVVQAKAPLDLSFC